VAEVALHTVWVTESYVGRSVPAVTQYTLVEQRLKTITVLVRGSKQVIRETSGRLWFTDEAKLKDYLVRYATRQAESYERQAKELRAMLAAGEFPLTVVPDKQRPTPPPKPGYLEDN
jgi:hypothetical protein